MTNVMRRKDRDILPGDLGDEGPPGDIASPESDILTRLEDEELRSFVGRAIDLLPEKQRTAVTLFYVQDMTYEEIAQITGQPMGSVKTHLFRGREALRRSVSRQWEARVKSA